MDFRFSTLTFGSNPILCDVSELFSLILSILSFLDPGSFFTENTNQYQLILTWDSWKSAVILGMAGYFLAFFQIRTSVLVSFNFQLCPLNWGGLLDSSRIPLPYIIVGTFSPGNKLCRYRCTSSVPCISPVIIFITWHLDSCTVINFCIEKLHALWPLKFSDHIFRLSQYFLILTFFFCFDSTCWQGIQIKILFICI